ncbi:hypothetical protein ACFPYI_14875 [Halomarina salina]|uniref:Uncharacterized protein n=1 Tax=Halomarina salina TaxID=1872699 RepID=A0ABD5RQU5_9EURY|nr:hypothetical protein [Halomarina salina]
MVEPPSPSPPAAVDESIQNLLEALTAKDDAWWDQLAERAEDDPRLTVRRRPPTHLTRLEDPPAVPLAADRPEDLVWLEWVTWDDDSPVEHDHYHHPLGHVAPDIDCHPADTIRPPVVLTRMPRADELGADPCPECWPTDHAEPTIRGNGDR